MRILNPETEYHALTMTTTFPSMGKVDAAVGFLKKGDKTEFGMIRMIRPTGNTFWAFHNVAINLGDRIEAQAGIPHTGGIMKYTHADQTLLLTHFGPGDQNISWQQYQYGDWESPLIDVTGSREGVTRKYNLRYNPQWEAPISANVSWWEDAPPNVGVHFVRYTGSNKEDFSNTHSLTGNSVATFDRYRAFETEGRLFPTLGETSSDSFIRMGVEAGQTGRRSRCFISDSIGPSIANVSISNENGRPQLAFVQTDTPNSGNLFMNRRAMLRWRSSGTRYRPEMTVRTVYDNDGLWDGTEQTYSAQEYQLRHYLGPNLEPDEEDLELWSNSMRIAESMVGDVRGLGVLDQFSLAAMVKPGTEAPGLAIRSQNSRGEAESWKLPGSAINDTPEGVVVDPMGTTGWSISRLGTSTDVAIAITRRPGRGIEFQNQITTTGQIGSRAELTEMPKVETLTRGMTRQFLVVESPSENSPFRGWSAQSGWQMLHTIDI